MLHQCARLFVRPSVTSVHDFHEAAATHTESNPILILQAKCRLMDIAPCADLTSEI